MYTDGMSSKQRVTYNMDSELEEALASLSYKTGFAKSDIIRRLIRKFLPQFGEELIEEARERLDKK